MRRTTRIISLLMLLCTPLRAEPEVRQEGQLTYDGIPPVADSLRETFEPYSRVYGFKLIGYRKDGAMVVASRKDGQIHLRWLEPPKLGPDKKARPVPGEIHAGPAVGPEFEDPRPRPGHEGQYLFSKDATEGREVGQYYLFDEASGESRLLTDGRSRHLGATWSPDGERFVCAAGDRNGNDFDVLLVTVDGKRTRLTRKPGLWIPMAWSPDGKRLLVNHVSFSGDKRLFVMELPKRTLRAVYSGPQRVVMTSPVFLPSGKLVYLSDLDSQYQRLRLWDPQSGLDKSLLDLPWDVHWVACPSGSKGSDRLVFSVNRHGRDVFYGWLMGQEPPTVLQIPEGIASKVCFTANGQQMGIELDVGASPPALYSYSFVTGKSQLWSHGAFGGSSEPRVPKPRVVNVTSFDGRAIPAYLYMPPKTTLTPVPVMISVHGGPEAQHQPRFSALILFITRELGWAVLAPNIRGSDGYGKAFRDLDNGRLRENALRDVGSLLDWVATQPTLDPARVVVEGSSYGGYVALASAALYSDRTWIA